MAWFLSPSPTGIGEDREAIAERSGEGSVAQILGRSSPHPSTSLRCVLCPLPVGEGVNDARYENEMTTVDSITRNICRRTFLGRGLVGLGALAFNSMIDRPLIAAAQNGV